MATTATSTSVFGELSTSMPAFVAGIVRMMALAASLCGCEVTSTKEPLSGASPSASPPGAPLDTTAVATATSSAAPEPASASARALAPLRGLSYLATSHRVVEAMLDLAQVTTDDVVYDLGCGDGRILVAAAKRGARAYGVDIDPARVHEARANVENAGVAGLVEIEQRDMFTVDLSPATVVTLFVTTSYNERLLPQLAQLEPGSRVVSYWFDIPGYPPDEIVRVPYGRDINWPRPGEPRYGEPNPVYLWTVPIARSLESP
jgi:SAM-dependent methyltransferase